MLILFYFYVLSQDLAMYIAQAGLEFVGILLPQLLSADIIILSIC